MVPMNHDTHQFWRRSSMAGSSTPQATCCVAESVAKSLASSDCKHKTASDDTLQYCTSDVLTAQKHPKYGNCSACKRPQMTDIDRERKRERQRSKPQ